MLVIQTYHSVEICLRFGGSFFISDPMPVSSSTRMQHFLLFILCRLYAIVILNVQIKYRMIIKCGLNNAFMV